MGDAYFRCASGVTPLSWLYSHSTNGEGDVERCIGCVALTESTNVRNQFELLTQYLFTYGLEENYADCCVCLWNIMFCNCLAICFFPSSRLFQDIGKFRAKKYFTDHRIANIIQLVVAKSQCFFRLKKNCFFRYTRFKLVLASQISWSTKKEIFHSFWFWINSSSCFEISCD